MTDIPFNRRLFNIVIWIFAGLCLLVILTSCSGWDPYAALEAQPSPTAAAPAATRPAAVTTVTPSPIPLPVCTVSTGIDAGRLNIRAGASVKYAVLRVLQEGDVLTMTGGEAGNWIQVRTRGNVTGWINSIYCRKGK